MGKGGSSGNQTVTNRPPEEVMPYLLDVLQQGRGLTGQEYTPYPGQRLAGVSPDVMVSDQMVRNVAQRGIPGLDTAMGMTMANANNIGAVAGPGQGYGFSGYGGFRESDFFPSGNIYETQFMPPAEFSQYGGTRASEFSPSGDISETQFMPAAEFRKYGGFKASEFSPSGGISETQFKPAAEFSGFGFQGPEKFTGDNVGQYMSPYMQQVAEIQKQQAMENFQTQAGQRAASAVQSGAFGGSRQGVVEATAQKDLMSQMAEIDATSRQKAYEDAQAAFESDRAAQEQFQQNKYNEQYKREMAQAEEYARSGDQLAAERARIQAAQTAELARVQSAAAEEASRVQAGYAGEEARVQAAQADEFARAGDQLAAERARVQAARVGELARVQSGVAGEASRVQAAQTAELARVQSAQAEEYARAGDQVAAERARVQAARTAELARIQAAQAGEASRVQSGQAGEYARVQAAQADENMRQRQFMLEGLGMSSDMAAQIAALGGQGRSADIEAAQLMEAIGLRQQGDVQKGLDLAYQDFINQRDYEKNQLADYVNIVYGNPLGGGDFGATTSPGPNPYAQALGGGISALGLSRAYG